MLFVGLITQSGDLRVVLWIWLVRRGGVLVGAFGNLCDFGGEEEVVVVVLVEGCGYGCGRRGYFSAKVGDCDGSGGGGVIVVDVIVVMFGGWVCGGG